MDGPNKAFRAFEHAAARGGLDSRQPEEWISEAPPFFVQRSTGAADGFPQEKGVKPWGRPTAGLA